MKRQLAAAAAHSVALLLDYFLKLNSETHSQVW